ncbi:MAG: tRNA pseudouridine(38-40) synthase TruA [Ignavibacteria bacterium]|nr:tRNA pseudouridine(38-40) synthase TruA [Ignavibacteria bacterium]
MRTLLLRVEYDGTNFGGWQFQLNAPTIQGELEKAWHKLTGSDERIVGAGRTDAGVHSRGQVAHIKIPDEFNIPDHKFALALNSRLPKSIRITATQVTELDIQARFDAISREYSYSITTNQSVFNRHFSWHVNYRFDHELLVESAAAFLGKHNFTTFSKRNDDTLSYVCDLQICEWTEIDNGLRLRIKADRFVYGMVRSLVGAMMDTATHKLTISNLIEYLHLADRQHNSTLAPPQGLILEKIGYPAELGVMI